MFIIPHFIFLCIYSFAIERWGTQLQYQGVHPDFFLPIFVYLLHKSPYQHLVLLIGLVGCFADVIQGHSWAQITCWYVLLYLLLDKTQIANKSSNFLVYIFYIAIIGMLQPLWLQMTGIEYATPETKTQIFVNIVYSSICFLILKVIKCGWGVPKHRSAQAQLNG